MKASLLLRSRLTKVHRLDEALGDVPPLVIGVMETVTDFPDSAFRLLSMNYQKVKAEAATLIEDAKRTGVQVELVEYLNRQRYLADHPNGLPFAHHNSLVRAVMREAIQARVPFRRRFER